MYGDRQMTKWVTEGRRKEAGEGTKDKVLFVREGRRRAAAAGVRQRGLKMERTPLRAPLKVG